MEDVDTAVYISEVPKYALVVAQSCHLGLEITRAIENK